MTIRESSRRLIVPCLLLPAALLLLACSSQPGRSYTDIGMQETLETRILPDTSKMFTYRLRLPPEQIPNHIRVIETSSRAEPRKGGIEINRNTARRLQENAGWAVKGAGFCRDGFFTLDQSVSRYHLWLNGECRDGATDDDRREFGESGTIDVTARR